MQSTQHHIPKLHGIFKKAIDSVLPWKLLTEVNGIKFTQKAVPNSYAVSIQDNQHDFTDKRIFVIGFGKAVLGMAVQLEKSFDHLEGILSIPHGTLAKFADNPNMKLRQNTAIQVIEGAKGNYPDESAMRAAKLIQQKMQDDVKDTIIFVLVSGGGSALLPLPRPPFSLTDKMQLIRSLSNAGASIDEMNLVRIALSEIKGGRLAAMAKDAHAIISFIISDIVGDPIELIASGPTVPLNANKIHNLPTPRQILEKYNLWQNLSAEKCSVLEEALPSSDNLPIIENNFHYIVANNKMAIKAAMVAAEQLNYIPCVLSTTLEGEVSMLAKQHIKFLKLIVAFRRHEIKREQLHNEYPFDVDKFEVFENSISQVSDRPVLLILAGEPTVKVTGCGLGGRNQQLALQMSYEMHGCSELQDFLFFSAGTDGIDGPTPAAGAIGCSQVISDELKQNPTDACPANIWQWIENNDSYSFYNQLENGKYHVVTGHTGINVMDLHFIVVPPTTK